MVDTDVLVGVGVGVEVGVGSDVGVGGFSGIPSKGEAEVSSHAHISTTKLMHKSSDGEQRGTR